MTPQEIKPIIESLLFAAGAPVSLRRLSEVIGVAQAEIKPALILLQEDYRTPDAVFPSLKWRGISTQNRRGLRRVCENPDPRKAEPLEPGSA